LIAEIGDASFLIVLDFRKPAPRSQGCEVRAFPNSLDTGGVEKFQRVGIEETLVVGVGGFLPPEEFFGT
jgi:hypothetical protein